MSNPQKPPSWPKTKLAFYIWWIFLTAMPSIFSLASLSDVLKPPPGDGRNQHKEKRRLIEWVLFLSVLVSNLSLLYYLSIKLRAHRSRSWGPAVESPAVAAERFIMTERKGAAILLIAATAWVPAVGGTVLMMLMATIVVRSLFLDVAMVVGMPSLIGHLLYVWGRSLRIVVMGSRKGRGVAEGEEGDGQDGEMLSPLGGEQRV